MYAINLLLTTALVAGGTGTCGAINADGTTSSDSAISTQTRAGGKGQGMGQRGMGNQNSAVTQGHGNKGQGHSGSTQQNMQGAGEWTAISGEPSGEMTQEVLDMLVFIAQEEKVAKDLYTVIGAEYGVRPMTNISKSETQHQSAVVALLAKYGYENPTTGLAVGEFEDPALQALYDQLYASVTDYASAIAVGVAVEETDIADLLEMLEADLPSDVKTVLENLLKGSYNHLAAFSR
jgi:hypothetical protein